MPTQNLYHPHENPPVFSKHTITVLLVDDQEIVAEAVRRMLAGEPDIKLEYCPGSHPSPRYGQENTPHHHFAGFDLCPVLTV